MTSTNSTHTVKGRTYVRVTRVLHGLNNYAAVSREVLERAADRGSKADRAIMLYTDNNLDESTLDPVLVPYLAGWKQAVNRYGIKVLFRQRRVVHELYGYAGTIDLGLEMERPPDHVRLPDIVLADLKCVDTVPASAQLQLAAYEAAFNLEMQRRGQVRRATHRLVIQLTQEGQFIPTWCDDGHDFTVFMSCLNRLNYCIKKGLEQL